MGWKAAGAHDVVLKLHYPYKFIMSNNFNLKRNDSIFNRPPLLYINT